ncbi:MAG: hypothetical protein J5824_09000 [Lachnospiraceae bacterium]|nr:hypothetical protein [Lachnospiraceae bacterium]
MKAFTFNRYRAVNIAIMTLLFSIAEALIVTGARRWFPELPYTLSLSILFISLEIMRWRGSGAISAIAGGFVFCLASGADARYFAIYCLGNLFAMAVLVFVKAVGRNKIRQDAMLSVCYVVLVFLAACIGRYCVSLIFAGEPLMIVQYLTTDLLSLLFAVVAVLIVRNADGIFEDQKDYLFRLERERKEKAGEQDGMQDF